MIGCNELVRLVGQDGKGDTPVALVFRLLPDPGQHQLLAVLAAEIKGLLAPFFAPFVKTFGGDDAALFLQVCAELPSAHSVRAGIKQRRARFSAGAGHMNPEATENHAVPCDYYGDGFSWRDIRIELEIDARPAVKVARDLRPFPDRTEAIAHWAKVGSSQLGSSSRLGIRVAAARAA